MRRILALLTLAYTGALLVWFIASRTLGDRPWWLALVTTFALYLFAPLPLAALLAWVSRQRAAWGAVGVAVGLWGVLYGALWLPNTASSPASEPSLLVYTQNTPFPYAGGTETQLIAGLRGPNADILFLQELDRATLPRLEQQLGDMYPYRVSAWTGGFTYAIFSRYPLRQEAILHQAVPDRPILIASATVEGQAIVLVNLHPVATNGANSFGEVPAMIQTTFRQRDQQVAEVITYLAEERRPVILAGDLNTTDTTAAYRQLASRYRDSWREIGTGWGHTFPATPFVWRIVPMPARAIRIDYVFHSAHFVAMEARNVNTGVSDHLGLVVRLKSMDK